MRHTDGQTKRQNDKNSDRDDRSNGLTYRQSDRHRDKKTDAHIDSNTDRQQHRRTHADQICARKLEARCGKSSLWKTLLMINIAISPSKYFCNLSTGPRTPKINHKQPSFWPRRKSHGSDILQRIFWQIYRFLMLFNGFLSLSLSVIQSRNDQIYAVCCQGFLCPVFFVFEGVSH